MRGIERWTGTEWLLESLLELVQQCRGVGALGPCCIGIALLLLWLLLCEVEVEVEVEEAAKAAANTKQCSRMRLDRFLVIGGE